MSDRGRRGAVGVRGRLLAGKLRGCAGPPLARRRGGESNLGPPSPSSLGPAGEGDTGGAAGLRVPRGAAGGLPFPGGLHSRKAEMEVVFCCSDICAIAKNSLSLEGFVCLFFN